MTAGAIALRTLSVLLVIAGFWPFLWVILELLVLLHGGESQYRFQGYGGSIRFDFVGWPAVVWGLIYSVLLWCAATIACGFGYAMYILRDLVPPGR